MTVGDPDGPGNVKVCKTTLYDTEFEELMGVSLPTEVDGPTIIELLLGNVVPEIKTTGDGVSVVRVRE